MQINVIWVLVNLKKIKNKIWQITKNENYLKKINDDKSTKILKF